MNSSRITGSISGIFELQLVIPQSQPVFITPLFEMLSSLHLV